MQGRRGWDAGRARHDDFAGVSVGGMLGYRMTKTKIYTYVPEVPKIRPLSNDYCLKYLDQGLNGSPMIEILYKSDYRANVFYCDTKLGIATNNHTCVSLEHVSVAKDFLDEHLAAKPVEYTFEYEGPHDGLSAIVIVSKKDNNHGVLVTKGLLRCSSIPDQVLAAAKKFLRECVAETERDKEPTPETFVRREEKQVKYGFKAGPCGYVQYYVNDKVVASRDVPQDVHERGRLWRRGKWIGAEYSFYCHETTAREYLARCEGKTVSKNDRADTFSCLFETWNCRCVVEPWFAPIYDLSTPRDYLKDRSWTK